MFIGSHSHFMYALNLNGHCLWSCRLGDRIEASAVISPCQNYIIVGV